MKLSDLFLNRFLYKAPQQNLETKDAVYDSSNVIPVPVPPLASGEAAQDLNTGNVTINGDTITPGTFPPSLLDVANWGWGQTCAFVSDSDVQVSWGAGTFKSANGATYTISAGNTGTMGSKNYIYLDLNVSETVYQVTTNPATAVGIGKVLIAVANPGATEATYNLSEATQIVGDNILANTINASKISVGQLSAISADLGAITAGSININDVFTVDSAGNTKVNSLERNDFHWFTLFESIDGYAQSISGTGTVILGQESVNLTCGNVIGNITEIQKIQSSANSTFSWDQRRKLKTLVHAIDLSLSVYVVTGSGQSTTARHIGFKLNGGSLIGVVANGTTETTISLGTYSAGDFILLEAQFTNGVGVDFYVNGAFIGTITTTLPTGNSNAGWLLDVVNTTTFTNVSKEIDICYWDFWQAND